MWKSWDLWIRPLLMLTMLSWTIWVSVSVPDALGGDIIRSVALVIVLLSFIMVVTTSIRGFVERLPPRHKKYNGHYTVAFLISFISGMFTLLDFSIVGEGGWYFFLGLTPFMLLCTFVGITDKSGNELVVDKVRLRTESIFVSLVLTWGVLVTLGFVFWISIVSVVAVIIYTCLNTRRLLDKTIAL